MSGRAATALLAGFAAAWLAASDALAQQAPGAAHDDGEPGVSEPADFQWPLETLPSLARRRGWRGLVQLKRQNTSRNSPDESTKTTLRIDTFFDAPVSLFRLEIPFPDEETDFSGSPFNPRLGDIKTRIGFRALKADRYSFRRSSRSPFRPRAPNRSAAASIS